MQAAQTQIMGRICGTLKCNHKLNIWKTSLRFCKQPKWVHVSNIYIIWSCFSIWIQWWCSIGVWSYKTSKPISLIHLLELFFNANSMAMSVSWSSEWLYMAIPVNTCVFAGLTIYGHTKHQLDITIEFISKNSSRWCIALVCLLISPYMGTLIAKLTSPWNLGWKTTPEDV